MGKMQYREISYSALFHMVSVITYFNYKNPPKIKFFFIKVFIKDMNKSLCLSLYLAIPLLTWFSLNSVSQYAKIRSSFKGHQKRFLKRIKSFGIKQKTATYNVNLEICEYKLNQFFLRPISFKTSKKNFHTLNNLVHVRY